MIFFGKEEVKFTETILRDAHQSLMATRVRTVDMEKIAPAVALYGQNLFSLEMFENIAYVMAKHADPSIPDTPEEWLDGFNTFSIYQILPQLIDLWGLNVQTTVEARKNLAKVSGK